VNSPPPDPQAAAAAVSRLQHKAQASREKLAAARGGRAHINMTLASPEPAAATGGAAGAAQDDFDFDDGFASLSQPTSAPAPSSAPAAAAALDDFDSFGSLSAPPPPPAAPQQQKPSTKPSSNLQQIRIQPTLAPPRASAPAPASSGGDLFDFAAPAAPLQAPSAAAELDFFSSPGQAQQQQQRPAAAPAAQAQAAFDPFSMSPPPKASEASAPGSGGFANPFSKGAAASTSADLFGSMHAAAAAPAAPKASPAATAGGLLDGDMAGLVSLDTLSLGNKSCACLGLLVCPPSQALWPCSLPSPTLPATRTPTE